MAWSEIAGHCALLRLGSSSNSFKLAYGSSGCASCKEGMISFLGGIVVSVVVIMTYDFLTDASVAFELLFKNGNNKTRFTFTAFGTFSKPPMNNFEFRVYKF